MKAALILILLLMLIPSVLASGEIPAADPALRLYDYANVLSQDQEDSLNSQLETAKALTGVDFVIFTYDDEPGMDEADFVDHIYWDNGFGVGNDADGVMLYINMATRELHFRVFGYCDRLYTSADIESVLDNVADYLSAKRYSDGCSVFIEDAQAFILAARSGSKSEGYPGGTNNYPYMGHDTSVPSGLISQTGLISVLIIAGLMMLIVSLIGLRGVSRSKPGTSAYLRPGSVNLRHKEDRFLRTHTSRVKIDNDSHNGGKGGGGGGGGGGFSGGRTSGGGHRKF